MTTLADRVKQRMADLGLTEEQVVERANRVFSQAAFHKIKSGKTKQTKYIIQISHALECNSLWLATGVGSPSSNEEFSIRISDPAESRKAAHLIHGTYVVKEQDGATGNASRFTSLPIRNVPVINKKNILERINPAELTPETHKDWCPTRSVSAKAFALSAQELPTPNDRFGFHPSSLIIIDPDYEIETGKLVLVLDANNNLSIKRYEAIGKLNYLGSFNENYQPILLDETFHLIGRVAGSYQEF